MCSGRRCKLVDFEPTGGGACPVQWELVYQDRVYYIHYRGGWLTIDADADTDQEKEVFLQALAPERANDGYWSDEETNVYLHLISDAIRNDTLADLRIPKKVEVRQSEHYCRGAYPVYVVRDESGNDLEVPASELFDHLSADGIRAHVESQRNESKF